MERRHQFCFVCLIFALSQISGWTQAAPSGDSTNQAKFLRGNSLGGNKNNATEAGINAANSKTNVPAATTNTQAVTSTSAVTSATPVGPSGQVGSVNQNLGAGVGALNTSIQQPLAPSNKDSAILQGIGNDLNGIQNLIGPGQINNQIEPGLGENLGGGNSANGGSSPSQSFQEAVEAAQFENARQNAIQRQKDQEERVRAQEQEQNQSQSEGNTQSGGGQENPGNGSGGSGSSGASSGTGSSGSGQIVEDPTRGTGGPLIQQIGGVAGSAIQEGLNNVGGNLINGLGESNLLRSGTNLGQVRNSALRSLPGAGSSGFAGGASPFAPGGKFSGAVKVPILPSGAANSVNSGRPLPGAIARPFGLPTGSAANRLPANLNSGGLGPAVRSPVLPGIQGRAIPAIPGLQGNTAGNTARPSAASAPRPGVLQLPSAIAPSQGAGTASIQKSGANSVIPRR